MQAFELNHLLRESSERKLAWHEFLRTASLSMGLYCLKAGQDDQQQPHGEDEVYCVLGGKGSFRAGENIRAVSAGSVIFVERSVEHRFCDITEDLSVLVFFAPPEGSLPR
jgi:quercetin dioxygenase-like cupin family protein